MSKQYFIPHFIVFLTFFVLVAVWSYLVDLHAVDLIFFDQWRTYTALFEDAGWWRGFTIQLGPHRQGVGFFVIKLVAEISGWNTRAEVFALVLLVLIAAVAALALKIRLAGALRSSDAAIPLIFFSPVIWGVFFFIPNPAHGVLPLVMLIFYGWAWIQPSAVLRYPLVLMLNFFLIYTGFGIFVGIITPLLLAFDAVHGYRTSGRETLRLPLLALGIAILSMGSFFLNNYRFKHIDRAFVFSNPETWLYPKFVSLMFGNFVIGGGTATRTTVIGSFLTLIMLAVLAIHIRRLIKSNSSLDRIIVIFLAFSMLFAFNAAIGRVSFGIKFASSSRYMPYLVPAFFAIYLHLTSSPITLWRRSGPRVVLAVFAISLLIQFSPSYSLIITYKVSKQKWIESYRESGNIGYANQKSGLVLHPNPKRVDLEARLIFLRQQRLSFYRND